MWNVPGRKEFTSYLPENTQAVVVQPVGDAALLIAASDTQRGFNKVDQVRILWPSDACWANHGTCQSQTQPSCVKF